jgi:hypothetical protein
VEIILILHLETKTVCPGYLTLGCKPSQICIVQERYGHGCTPIQHPTSGSDETLRRKQRHLCVIRYGSHSAISGGEIANSFLTELIPNLIEGRKLNGPAKGIPNRTPQQAANYLVP